MERRNRSLKALEELNYIDSLEDEQRAQALKDWALTYFNTTDVTDFDFEPKELQRFAELFYKNTKFLENYKEEVLKELNHINKVRKFLKN